MAHKGGNLVVQITQEEHLHAAEAKRVVPLALQEDGQYGQQVLLPTSASLGVFKTVTVTTTSTKLVDANTARRMIIISRADGEDLFVGPNDSVTTTKGRRVRSSDVGFVDAGPGMWMGAWYGRVAAGTLTVVVEEFEA